jgi:hypothetical protein
LCLYARQVLTSEHNARIAEIQRARQINWDSLVAVAESEAIAPLVYHHLMTPGEQTHLRETGISQTAASQLKRAYIKNVLVKKNMQVVLGDLLGLFDRLGIPVMLIKGAALGIQVYDQPWYSVSHDIDLVLHVQKSELSQEIRQEIAWAVHLHNRNKSPYHESIEYEYFEHHDITMNGFIPVDFKRIWQGTIPARFGTHPVQVMSPEDMLLAAAINACRKRYFKLKSLFDILTIVEKYPALDWSLLATRAWKYRCNGIILAALRVAEILMGCPVPQGFFDELKVNPLRAELTDRLIQIMLEKGTIANLNRRGNRVLFGREPSFGLLLTYASYRFDQLPAKISHTVATRKSSHELIMRRKGLRP